ncbi:MAG TPA: S9 family peptidase [Arenimonas sp.]|uniref:alpha/beta hydrolase family protein n=1 Tax=Arenimonas sp. TaxID=1872635 RepID=UPI002D801A87|nr:S9 family peptidase [Arenimonas sp.]HEU0153048.1 S9 family peptidase [Arenimonas sp.]
MKTAIAMIGLLAASSHAAELPPVEDFVRQPVYSSARISPGGDYLALLVDRGEQDVVTVLRMSDLSVMKINQLPDNKSAAGIRWIGDDRLVFTAIRKFGGFAAPFGTGEWFAVNADGTKPEAFIFYGSRGVTEQRKTVGNQSFSMLDPLIDDPRNVLMQASYPRSNEGAGTEVFMVDTVSGSRKSLGRAPRENCGLVLDEKKEVRYAVCYDQTDDQGRYDPSSELHRRNDDGSWSLVNNGERGGKQLRVMGTDKSGTIYAMADDGKAPPAFGTLDASTGEFRQVFKDEVSEVSNWISSPTDETVLAVVTEAGAPRVTLVNEEHPDAQLYASLAGAFPGQMVNFSSATRDGKQIIVSVYSDKNPGELYLFDRTSGKARFLLKSRDWIDPSQSASIRPFNFKSRDGLTIHGYLTLPKDSAGKKLPMIVMPHGGPMGPRDNWGYNGETQLFASRGYAVLQINFRGSGGFGKAFQDMAYGQWHTGIMNDIIDGTNWAIQDGVADANRICIYGGSFGGYASLMAPARAPDLFSCAFGYVGMYDAQIQMKLSDTSKSDGGMRYLSRAFGATRAEQDAMSPITYADRIKVPVMLAAGARDPRCPPEHTEAMFAALEKAGNKPEDMIIASGEMHGFYKLENNVDLYTRMLAFFGRHIGGSVEVGDVETERQASTAN